MSNNSSLLRRTYDKTNKLVINQKSFNEIQKAFPLTIEKLKKEKINQINDLNKTLYIHDNLIQFF